MRANPAWRANSWPKPEVSDNGMLTAFSFVGNIPTPAVYSVSTSDCGPGGTETQMSFSDRRDLKIVASVAQHWRLRLGDAVAEVCNNAWDGGVGQNPGTGTISPEIVRTVRQAVAK